MSSDMFLRGALALVTLAACVRGVATADDCLVERVADGDTFYCRDGRKVRLIGIDTPELAQGADGRLARDALRRLLPEGRYGASRARRCAAGTASGRLLAHVGPATNW
jgi:endonuclease YncB( thermonuclease family)